MVRVTICLLTFIFLTYLVFIFLKYLVFRFVRASMPGSESYSGKDVVDEMIQDPNCKTYICIKDAKRKIIDGKEYFFCSEQCADNFHENC